MSTVPPNPDDLAEPADRLEPGLAPAAPHATAEDKAPPSDSALPVRPARGRQPLWPPPAAARWVAMGLFLFALALHLSVAFGGVLVGIDFKTLIVLDEIGAILLAPMIFLVLLRLPIAEGFMFRKASWPHYAVAIAGAWPLQMLGGAIQEMIIDSLPNSEALREFLRQAMEPLLQADSAADMAMLLFGAVILAAVCEEILFRGLMLRLLTLGGNWVAPLFVTALLFAAFHLDPFGLLPRTLMGVYFGLLVWRSGSIFPAMVAHGANNLLAFATVAFFDDAAIAAAAEAPGPPTEVIGAGAALIFAGILYAYLRWVPRATATARTEPSSGAIRWSPPTLEMAKPQPSTPTSTRATEPGKGT